MTKAEIESILKLIALRREEILSTPHPSVYKEEYIRLIKAELAYTNELERR